MQKQRKISNTTTSEIVLESLREQIINGILQPQEKLALTFSSVLRKSFDEALNVTGTCPENSLLYVALGAALYADKAFVLSEVADALDRYAATATYASEPPLFASKEARPKQSTT